MNVIKYTTTDNNIHNSRVFYQLSQHLLLCEMKQQNKFEVFGERELTFMFAICHRDVRLSVCSLSPVCL